MRSNSNTSPKPLLQESALTKLFPHIMDSESELITFDSLKNALALHQVEILKGINVSTNPEMFEQYVKEIYQMLIHQKNMNASEKEKEKEKGTNTKHSYHYENQNPFSTNGRNGNIQINIHQHYNVDPPKTTAEWKNQNTNYGFERKKTKEEDKDWREDIKRVANIQINLSKINQPITKSPSPSRHSPKSSQRYGTANLTKKSASPDNLRYYKPNPFQKTTKSNEEQKEGKGSRHLYNSISSSEFKILYHQSLILRAIVDTLYKKIYKKSPKAKKQKILSNQHLRPEKPPMKQFKSARNQNKKDNLIDSSLGSTEKNSKFKSAPTEEDMLVYNESLLDSFISLCKENKVGKTNMITTNSKDEVQLKLLKSPKPQLEKAIEDVPEDEDLGEEGEENVRDSFPGKKVPHKDVLPHVHTNQQYFIPETVPRNNERRIYTSRNHSPDQSKQILQNSIRNPFQKKPQTNQIYEFNLSPRSYNSQQDKLQKLNEMLETVERKKHQLTNSDPKYHHNQIFVQEKRRMFDNSIFERIQNPGREEFFDHWNNSSEVPPHTLQTRAEGFLKDKCIIF